MIVYACSTNAGKLREFALAGTASPISGLQIEPLPNLRSVPAPEETGSTFEENAAIKAIYYSQLTPELIFADDSGLQADALRGEPGVYSARYAGPNATDGDNNALLLSRLSDALNRHGRFVCAIALAQAGRLITTVGGTVEGEILEGPRGSNGFGYDPLFFYPPLRKGFAELSSEEKFEVSHRGKAIRALLHFLARERS